MAGKVDIVEHIVNSLDGLTKKQASETIDAILDCVLDCLADGERVSLPGFGTFGISERKERQGRNPQTGKTITLPADKRVSFKASKALKDAVNS